MPEHRHRYPDGHRCECGRVRDEWAAIRGARSQARGVAIEDRQLARMGVETLGGNRPGIDGLDHGGEWSVTVKSKRPAEFPGWMASQIDYARRWQYAPVDPDNPPPIRPNRTPLLLVVEAGGQRPRALVVMDLEDWLRLRKAS